MGFHADCHYDKFPWVLLHASLWIVIPVNPLLMIVTREHHAGYDSIFLFGLSFRDIVLGATPSKLVATPTSLDPYIDKTRFIVHAGFNCPLLLRFRSRHRFPLLRSPPCPRLLDGSLVGHVR